MKKPKHTPAVLEQFRAAMAAKRADPAFNAKSAAARAATFAWPLERVERLRAIMMAGQSLKAAARELGASHPTIVKRMQEHGITLGDPEAPARQARLEAALRAHYPTSMQMADLVLVCTEAAGRLIRMRTVYYEAMKLGLLRPVQKAAERKLRDWPAETAARRVALAPKVQSMLDAGVSLVEVYKELRVGAVCVRRMRNDGVVTLPVRLPVVKAPKPPREPKALTSQPRPQAIVYGARDTRRPPIGPMQSVAEFLAAGGSVTRCPAALLLETTATISATDMAALASHRAAQGGYGVSESWLKNNRRSLARLAERKANAKPPPEPEHVEQDRIAA